MDEQNGRKQKEKKTPLNEKKKIGEKYLNEIKRNKIQATENK